MSLPEVLSAMRSLILDGVQLPETGDLRRIFLGEHFPGLSPEEVEDLAKIAPRRFRTYSNSIYSGQANILCEKFPVSTALLRRYIPGFSGFSLAQEMHRKLPWIGNSTEALARNFVCYAAEPKFTETLPELPECAALELDYFLIMRAENDLHPPQMSLPLVDLETLNIAALLECEVSIPHYVATKAFSFDIPAFRRDFFANGGMLTEGCAKERPLSVVTARSRDHYTRTLEVEPYVREWIESVERSSYRPLEPLAQLALENACEGESETEICQRFVIKVLELGELGAFVLRSGADRTR